MNPPARVSTSLSLPRELHLEDYVVRLRRSETQRGV
jgi:hypothetical protein